MKHEEIVQWISDYEKRRYQASDYNDKFKKLSDEEWSLIYEYIDFVQNGTPPIPFYLQEDKKVDRNV